MVASIASLVLALLAFLYTHHPSCAQAAQSRLSLPLGWSFSADLSFPSPPLSSAPLNSYTNVAPFSLFVSIINSTSFGAGSKGFVLGFLSLFESPASSPTQIYLSICLGVSKNGRSSSPFLVPVWTLNTTYPLRQSARGLVKLEVNDNKELMLKDGDGSTLWRVSNVQSMQMQDNGNLAIYSSFNRTVWQSFDHPHDVLLQGQRLRVGMELTSSNHMYKAAMQPGGLVVYLDSANPVRLVYEVYAANKTVDDYLVGLFTTASIRQNHPINVTESLAALSCTQTMRASYTVLNGESLAIHDACGDLYSLYFGTSDLIRLDADGNMRDYYVHHEPDSSSYAITSSREDSNPCYTPNVCGAYGICSMSTFSASLTRHTCRCPSETDNASLIDAFNFINASEPSQGCQRTASLECAQASAQSLVEIKNVAFVSLLYIYELTWRENTLPLENCKAACLSNCSCSGFFYYSSSSYCLPFGDKTAMSNFSVFSLATDEHFIFVKIQLSSEDVSPSHTKKSSSAAIFVTAVLLALIVAAVIVAAMYMKWKQQRIAPELRVAEKELLDALPTLPTRFSYQELNRFTNGFSRPLGMGGSGSVYEGVLPDRRRVAVKKLELLSHGQKEFLAEIATIGGISHVNIVSLYGFCLEKHNRLLVYEYMENGSLDEWLFCKEGERQLCVMTWEARFKVALATARGLAYLHQECKKPIVHFDVKPQNILLDKEFNAKLSDFGLSKLLSREQSLVMTAFRGTPGYIAPEWVLHSKVSTKCDVYSFGMVLLELVSGRKNVEMLWMGSDERYSLPKWAAAKSREGNVGEVLDKRLVKNVERDGIDVDVEGNMMEQVKRAVGIALLCIHEEPRMRPSMMGVCSMLEGSMVLPKEGSDYFQSHEYSITEWR